MFTLNVGIYYYDVRVRQYGLEIEINGEFSSVNYDEIR